MEVSEDSNASDQVDQSELQKPDQQEDDGAPEAAEETEEAEANANAENRVDSTALPNDADGDQEVQEVADVMMDDEDLNEKKNKNAGGFTGRGVTLQMLVEDNILQPKQGAMSLEYMGQKFNGDLLADGKIFSAEVQEVFSSPSAWALKCKKIVNPDQKYGCGWSSVRYCGRPLDVYKNQWMKKRRLEHVHDNSTPDEQNSAEPTVEGETGTEAEPVFKLIDGDRQVVKHESLGNRNTIEDSNLLVETVTFATVGKLQPFIISLHSSAQVVMDVHCALTRSEVVGYLGGSWDANSNTLTIKQAFPCLCRLGDEKNSQATEMKIAQSMEASGLVLVGWYHSHPSSLPTPSVQDIDAQLEYQLKLKGSGDQGYRPCVAMISSPYCRAGEGQSTCYWVSPPTEARPQEVGKPMAMQYNFVKDSNIKEDIIHKLDACLKFYRGAVDHINFEENWTEEVTILEKLKISLKSNLPSEDDVSSVDELLECSLSSRKSKKIKLDSSPETPVESSSPPHSTQSDVPCQ